MNPSAFVMATTFVLNLRPALLEAAHTAHLPVSVLDALINHESRWIASAQGGRDKQCIGLGQVCLHTFAACRNSTGFAFDTPACEAQRARLLDGNANLRDVGHRLGLARDYCLKRTGHAAAGHVLATYGGWDRNGLVCGQRRSSTSNGSSNTNSVWVTALPLEVQKVLRSAQSGPARNRSAVRAGAAREGVASR